MNSDWTLFNFGFDHGEGAGPIVLMPAHTAHSRVGEVRCGDDSVVGEHVLVANQLADLLPKQGAKLVAHLPAMISDLAHEVKIVTEMLVYARQFRYEANQRHVHGGAVVADAVLLQGRVDRNSAL